MENMSDVDKSDSAPAIQSVSEQNSMPQKLTLKVAQETQVPQRLALKVTQSEARESPEQVPQKLTLKMVQPGQQTPHKTALPNQSAPPAPTPKQTPQKLTLKIAQPPQPGQQTPQRLTLKPVQAGQQTPQRQTLRLVQPGQVTQPAQQSPPTQGPRAEDYKKLELRDQIYLRQGMYIGSDEKIAYTDFVYDFESGKMTRVNLTLPAAVERLFLEILSNAGDNVDRSRKARVNPGTISVNMSKTCIKIRNQGLPIPVEIHPEYKVYCPELILGTLLTSSNYTQDTFFAGQNGYGAKLVNVFSKMFSVEIGDGIRGLHYFQTWTENMTVRSEPSIQPYSGESFVEITYVLDFLRFGYLSYPDEAFTLFCRHVADVSFTSKISSSFNGVVFNVAGISDAASLYYGKDNHKILHYEWPPGTQTTIKKGVLLANDQFAIPAIELCVVDTPGDAGQVSFVNGLVSRMGGCHVNEAYKIITDHILKTVNFRDKRKVKGKDREKSSRGKGKDKGTKDKKADKDIDVKFTVNDIKPNVSIILSVRVVNPRYDSQSKTFLTGPTPVYHIDIDLFKSVVKWNLIDRLYAILEAKQFSKLAKTDGKNKRFTGVEKLIDAGLVGPGSGLKCTLILTEGDSAKSYPLKLRDLEKDGPSLIGIYPMRGKMLNFMNAKAKQIMENKEYRRN